MAQNFRKLLDTCISEIHKSVNDKYNDTVKETELKHYDTKEYQAKDQLIKEMTNKISQLEKEKRRLESERDSLRPSVSFEWKEWLSENNYATRNATEAYYLACKELHNEPVHTNIEQFRLLSNKFMNAMNIAVWTKEQRNILMSFYNLDWKSLGIDIPPEMNFSEVEVKDGKIISDTSKLLSN